jgi:hypothetical protein
MENLRLSNDSNAILLSAAAISDRRSLWMSLHFEGIDQLSSELSSPPFENK